MKNYLNHGQKVTVTAPAAVTSGDVVAVGSLIGVAEGSAASGKPVVLVRSGIFSLPKISAQAWTVGAKIYWDSGASAMTTTATGNTLVGFAAEAAANPSATGKVCMDGAIR